MDFDRVVRAIAGLKLMKFFPADEDACLVLATDLQEMADTEEQIEWAIKRVRNLYKEWPGVHELRAVFCSRFRPKDGINAYSTVYLDGLPPSKEALGIAGPELKALPPGHVASVDNGAEAAVHVLSKVKEALNPMGGPATKADIAAAPKWLRQLEGYDD